MFMNLQVYDPLKGKAYKFVLARSLSTEQTLAFAFC